MAYGNTIVITVIILLSLSVLFSGCMGEKKIVPAPDSIQNEAVNVSAQNLTRSSIEENIPEISITSFSSIYLHDNNEDIYLFSWENVPGNASNGLLNYLKNDLHISWVENAQITKDEENNTIRVFTNENSIEIMLNNESVLLKKDRGYERYDLWVKEKNGTHDVYNKKYGNKYDISERYYAVYNLSIKNNGSVPLYFKLNGLRLYEGDQIFNTTTLEPYGSSSLLEVLQDLERENKLQDTTLLPGQSLNGIVAFRVNSLYNKSFLLKYKTTIVTSASFEKSIKALEAAEYFNYSVALGIPPYNLCREINGTRGSNEPIFDDLNEFSCETWANWVNRSIFEVYQKSDPERMQKSPPPLIPTTEMIYALRVIPERKITMSPVTRRFDRSHLLVTDDTGEEIINTSSIEGMAVLSNQTYTFKPDWMLNFPGMNISNASVVQISFKASYITKYLFSGTIGGTGRMSYINQDVILDDKLNIIVIRYYPLQIHAG
ncbi:MAG: hypothetical protein OIN66_04890 [Candidatus Methanoperedens sp.]|nr:hypothetical protein [Candidatus Methanoperedens sp.]